MIYCGIRFIPLLGRCMHCGYIRMSELEIAATYIFLIMLTGVIAIMIWAEITKGNMDDDFITDAKQILKNLKWYNSLTIFGKILFFIGLLIHLLFDIIAIFVSRILWAIDWMFSGITWESIKRLIWKNNR